MIKIDMEMHFGCVACVLFDNKKEDCSLCCHPKIKDIYTRPDWCPLQEAPEE